MSVDRFISISAGGRDKGIATLRAVSGCAIAALAILAATAGCLKLEPTLTLNADGSGELQLRYEISDTMVRQLAVAGGIVRQLDIASGLTNRAAATLPLLPFDEAEVRAMFAPFEERGVRLKSLRVESRRGWHTVAMQVDFSNLAALMQVPIFSPCGRSLTRTRAGSYQLAFEVPATARQQTPTDLAGDKARLQELQPFLTGLKVDVTINLPSDILETDAPRKTRRMAAWAFEFDRNPSAIDALNHKTFHVIFTSVGASPPEFSFPAK